MEYTVLAGAISVVLSHGNNLVNLIIDLKDARADIQDRVAKIDSHWRRTEVQLQFAQRTWSGLSEDHQNSQLNILTLLQSKVKSAEHRIQGLIRKQRGHLEANNEKLRIKRYKYLFIKPYLDSLIDDLAKWQALYDPSWYLIMRIADPSIDAELRMTDSTKSKEAAVVLRSARKVRDAVGLAVGVASADPVHVFLPSDGIAERTPERIPYSNAILVSRPGMKAPFVVDSIPCPRYSYAGSMAEDVRRLATKLHAVDPAAFGVLKCRGVVKWPPKNSGRITSFEMVLEAPSSDKPQTLRSYLVSRQTHSLTDRINLAKRLATSVNFVHTLDFVHKNIQPDNIIAFANADAAQLSPFYLIGFEQVRSDDGKTYLRGSENWAENIYRHPNRHGAHPEARYTMQHDIYSLGVCLLEVGLWSSFIAYTPNNETISGPGEVLGLTANDARQITPQAFKEHLVELARTRLPAAVGQIYAEVVVNCLTCLDPDNDDYGEISDVEDADGVVVGVKFIDQVLVRLNEISV